MRQVATRALTEIESDIVSVEARLRSLKIERARARKVPIAERNQAIVEDLAAGMDKMEACLRHGVSYSVVCNVWYDHRRRQQHANRPSSHAEAVAP